MSDFTCARCGSHGDASTARYDGAGDLVCSRCHSSALNRVADAEIREKDPGRADNMWAGALAAIVLGFMTLGLVFLGEWYFLLSPVAVYAGVHTGYRLFTIPEYRVSLGRRFAIAIAFCIVGSVLGVVATVLGLIGLLAGSTDVGF